MRKSRYKKNSLPRGNGNPLLIILSGTSGVGKDAVLSRLKESDLPLTYIITATTRSKRPREKDNVDYHFVSKDRFQEMIENKELLEWATVYDNWYGVPRQPVKQALEQGQDVVVKVDTQGALTIKKIVPQAIAIFLTSQSIEELARRLNQRGTESPGDLALRLKVAEEEVKQIASFDYIVVNRQDEIDSAVSEVKAIITAERCRVAPRQVTL